MDSIDINMGKLYVGAAPGQLSTSGIGSCVAVCLWSPGKKVGGLAHIMLPLRPNLDTEINETDFRYADIAISVMANELNNQGITNSQIVAKIVGGANMFPGVEGRSQKMGEKNVEAVKQTISNLHIPLAGEVTGGTSGRAVVFDLSNGIVTIKMTI